MKYYKAFLLAILLSVLAACDNEQQTEMNLPAVDVGDSEECHLCGMYVTRFSGPKGQTYLRRQKTPSHFCSTRDLFAYLLQPDVIPNIVKVFVHDMSKTDWRNPQHSQQMYIDAKTAYYVIGHSQKGAMGHTIGSFADEQAAKSFIKNFGGRVVRYQDISLDMLSQLNEY